MANDQPAQPYELNLGAAKTYIPGFVNIDIHENAELSLDLGVDKLPFPDDSVATIVSHHTLEHVPDYLFAMSEIHRVLMHDGELLLSLPYVTLTEHHLVNPYHLHNFNEHAFDFFDPRLLKGSAAEDGPTTFRKVAVRFTYIGMFGAAPRWLRVWSRRHLLNVVRQFDIALVAIKDPERPVDVSPERARKLEERMTELKRRRVQYAPAGLPVGAGAGGAPAHDGETIPAQNGAAPAGAARAPTPPRRGLASVPRRARRRVRETIRRRYEIRRD